jgi:hypothetical protein
MNCYCHPTYSSPSTSQQPASTYAQDLRPTSITMGRQTSKGNKKRESYLTRNCASESENSAWRWNSVACFSPWRKMTYKWKGALNVSVTSNCHLGDDTLSFHSRLSCLFRFCTPLRIPRSMHAQSNTETTTSWDRLRSGTRSSLRCRGNALTTISARSARLLSSTLWFTDVKFIFCTL